MFRKLLTFEEAKTVISQQLNLKPLGEEETHLLDAHERVLAEDVVSALDIPPFARSTVDGYAVKAEDTFGAEENQPVKLHLAGSVAIGEMPKVAVGKHEAAEIVTGAPIPKGADSVVMVEDTEKQGSEIAIYCSATVGENVMKQGADIKTGYTALKAGVTLGAREIGVLAALGLAKVKVFRVPVVAVLSTGGEVTEPGSILPPGKIFDINAYSLFAAVLEAGGKPLYAGVVPDEKTVLREALEKALTTADVVVTSGGVSVGPKYIIPETVALLGKPGLILSGVAVKPGKPFTVGLIDKKPVFCFPGHPTSALLMFVLFLRPVLRIMAGGKSDELPVVHAVAGGRMFSAKGRRTFIMVRLEKEGERYTAYPVESGASGAITTLAKANGFLEIAENQVFVDVGEEVVVSLFKSNA